MATCGDIGQILLPRWKHRYIWYPPGLKLWTSSVVERYVPFCILYKHVTDCRQVNTWGKDFELQQRQFFMSHYLLKSRNRTAGNPRDNIYRLYYLFKICGFEMPKPNHRLPIEDVYRGATEALVEKSGSWCILAQALNKREVPTSTYRLSCPTSAPVPSVQQDAITGVRRVWSQQKDECRFRIQMER